MALAERFPLEDAASLAVIGAHLPDYHSWWLASYTDMGSHATSIGGVDYVWVDSDAFKL